MRNKKIKKFIQIGSSVEYGFNNSPQKETLLTSIVKLRSIYGKAKLKSTSGEWLWGIDEKEEPMIRNGKIGPWKGPYHNGRACMEMLKRIH